MMPLSLVKFYEQNRKKIPLSGDRLIERMNEIEEQQQKKQKEMYENKNKNMESAMEIENEGNQPL